MKKTISLILALAMILSCVALAACSGGGSSAPAAIEAKQSEDKYRSFYQIWIGSFCDSNGDEVGDFQGIISKLDYINDGDPNGGDDLGMDGIWLSPMMPSKSYHKYNVRDYMAIDEEFGTMEDFEEFIAAAHERGIRVIIDLVLNHAGSDHEFFLKACDELRDGKEDGYARYFNVSTKSSTVYNRSIPNSDYYYEGEFSPDMPDWNLSYQGTRDYFEEVTKFWTDKGVDGFRLDAVKYFTDSNTDGSEFLKWFYEMAQGYNPEVYVVGEDWEEAGTIYTYYDTGVDSFFNFKFANSGGEFIIASHGMVEDLIKSLKKYDNNIKDHNEKAINANFLTNHDMVRLANMLEEDDNKFAAALYMLAPGNSFTYYGEEIGIEAPNTSNDASYRTAMIWDNDELPVIDVPGVVSVTENALGGVKQQLERETSLLNTYRKLVSLRLQNPEIARGNITDTVSFDDPRCAGFYIEYDGAKLLIIHNGNTEEKQVAVDMINNPELRGYCVCSVNEDGTTGEAKLSGTTLTIPAKTSVILKEN
ncbi:MAG: hypothetical protein IJJ15_07325 [Ruminococcus sp.]|nr:hypothetical protein [Ruminococcus sp.]